MKENMKDAKSIQLRIIGEKSAQTYALAKLIAHAGVIYGRWALCTEQAGPQIQRIPAWYDIIISELPIGHPVIGEPDMCICMDKIGCEAFKGPLSSQTNIFYDPLYGEPQEEQQGSWCKLPLAAHAKKDLPTQELWRIAMIGCVVRFVKMVSLDALAQAIRTDVLPVHVPAYLKALDLGSKLSKTMKCPFKG